MQTQKTPSVVSSAERDEANSENEKNEMLSLRCTYQGLHYKALQYVHDTYLHVFPIFQLSVEEMLNMTSKRAELLLVFFEKTFHDQLGNRRELLLKPLQLILKFFLEKTGYACDTNSLEFSLIEIASLTFLFLGAKL